MADALREHEETKVTMPTGYVDIIPPKEKGQPQSYTPLSELKAQGWEEVTNFHARFPEQWNDVAKQVKEGQVSGDWDYGLVRGQSEDEQRDSVTYLVRRKTEQRIAWDKEQAEKNK